MIGNDEDNKYMLCNRIVNWQGRAHGTAITFMMGAIGLSLPEVLLLKKVMWVRNKKVGFLNEEPY